MGNNDEKQREPYRVRAYQGKIHALYNRDAAAIFCEQYPPADPFEGVLIDAANLEITELVTVFQATKALRNEGNAAFAENLILSKGDSKIPVVRVNAKCADRCRFVDHPTRPKKLQVCQLLHEFFYGTGKSFAEKRQQIVDSADVQLLEYLQQVEESLQITAREMEVIIDAEN